MDFDVFDPYPVYGRWHHFCSAQKKTSSQALYVQWSKDAMKGFNYDPPSLLKTCDLLCVAIGGLV